jgi:acyl dehydratase
MPTLEQLPGLAGQRLGPTGWREMTQERVDEFADVTEDHNPIHVDPERAKESPFGRTIAHGYLSVALLAPISQELLDVEGATGVNYGMDRLRFPAPLPVGERFRGVADVAEVTEVKGGGMQVKATFTIEVEGQKRPAVVADCLFRYYA